jgi:MFS family permease
MNVRVSAPRDDADATASGVVAALLPIMVVVLSGFLVTGLAMPVLPLHVHEVLGLGEFVVGLIAGAQFAAALLTRFWAGNFADRRGAKYAVIFGLLLATAAGMLYLLSLRFLSSPTTSAVILLLGRAVLGAAESAMITGALSWGLAVGGQQNAGKVMAWVGTAMYAAFAGGAPAGSALYAAYGFPAVALATILIPLATLLVIAPLRGVAPTATARPPFANVLRAVTGPGIGLALSSFGFGAITTFVALVFAQRRWGQAWIAFTALSVTFILARLLFGHLPDKIGGARVALVSVILEAAGQAVIWFAPSRSWVFAGAALTGFGYSLVYPGFGVEAVRDVPPQSRGLAMGTYTAFLDLALGIANPVLGLVAGAAGVRSVFLVSAAVVLCAAAIAMRLLRNGGASRWRTA